MTQSRIDIQIKTADSWYALYNVAAIEFQLSDWKTSCLIVGIDENFNQSHYFHINYEIISYCLGFAIEPHVNEEWHAKW
jgi:hypothetical protein